MSRSGASGPERARGASAAALAAAAGILILLGATAGLRMQLWPFVVWYYLFAWLGVLLAGDGLVAWSRRDGPALGRFPLLGDPRRLARMLFWSSVLWLFYELINLRIQNWYYIFLPRSAPVRWTGTALAFTTVLPAVFLALAALDRMGLASNTRMRPVRLSARTLSALPWVGVAALALPLALPRYFFPLVWVALVPLLDPLVRRRAPDRSLLADLERGAPGRTMRLLAGGALIGFVWEMLNIGARTKWIYTVPWFEEATRLFEMPLLGFLGFPPFAVSCFVFWQALLVTVERPTAATARRSARAVAAIAGVLVLIAMDARTVVSTVPLLEELDPTHAGSLRAAGYDVFGMAQTSPAVLASVTGMAPEDATETIAFAQLTLLRGMGTSYAHALAAQGIASVEALAGVESDQVVEAGRAAGLDLPMSRAKVWVAAARARVAAATG